MIVGNEAQTVLNSTTTGNFHQENLLLGKNSKKE